MKKYIFHNLVSLIPLRLIFIIHTSEADVKLGEDKTVVQK